MGYINIEVGGSFRESGRRTFSAQSHGHAHAVAEAIEYLAGDVMREAINKDHQLHQNGHSPAAGFTRRPRNEDYAEHADQEKQ